MRNKPAFFFGLMDICCWYSGMCRTFREMGHEAEFLTLGSLSYSHWDLKDNKWPSVLFRRSYLKAVASEPDQRLKLFRLLDRLTFQLVKLVYIGWIALKFDVIVLKSGMTLTESGWDVRFFKMFGRTVIVQFHGSDSRPPYLGGHRDGQDADMLLEATRKTRAQVRRSSEWADYVIENPLCSHFHSRRICNYNYIGNPVDETKLAFFRQADAGAEHGAVAELAPVRILHCPSSPKLKGSDRIRDCIDRMRSKGYEIDYVEITGRPNSEVMQALADCDFAIDELYSDMFGAVFAIECCATGTPVVVGSYGEDILTALQDEESRLPSELVHPDALERAVEALLSDPAYRSKRSRDVMAYSEGFGHRKSIAKRLLRLATGDASDGWFVDPANVTYLHGCVAKEEHIRENIRKLVDIFGPEGLCLSDRPDLCDALVSFAYETTSKD